MIHFHPDENMLAEYAAGTLDTGLAIGVKAHIAMCPKCRNHVAELKQVGALFFDQSDDTAPAETMAVDALTSSPQSSSSFDALMARIKSESRPEPAAEEPTRVGVKNRHELELPAIVDKLLDQQGRLKWQYISPSLKQARLTTGQGQYEVCLHKIRKGGKVAEHDHRGTEVTVVLEGSFSDEGGRYHRGDFLLRNPGDMHRPTATQDQDCLCLSVVAAPVKLTGIFGKIVNPFLKVAPI